MQIKTVVDHERACGWRKPGGLYLVSGGLAVPCGKLPLELSVCPCCGAGIKPHRGFQWIDPAKLFYQSTCSSADEFGRCPGCPLSSPLRSYPLSGLLWVGEVFYKQPIDFINEAAALGISRRISQVPRDFKVGETWIYLAHRKAKLCPSCNGQSASKLNAPQCERCENTGAVSAIFQAFCPAEIQYVVNGDESEEELQSLLERGITPVRVEQAQTRALAI